MFLPDRYIKGECPQLRREGPVRRQLRGLRRGLRAHRAEEPVLGAVRRDAGAASSASTTSSSCPTRAASSSCKEWTAAPGRLQPEVLNKISEWFATDEHGHGGLADWDISRDAPYFGIEIPDAPGKYFYVWLDAPVGYLASLKNYFDKAARAGGEPHFDEFMADPAVEQVHFIGKDIIYFHTLFWPAMLQFSGRKAPDHVFVHGFLTRQRREDEQEPRHRHLAAASYLELGMNPEWLRYYIAAKLNAQRRGHRLQPRRLHRARQQRPDRQVHQHRQPRGRLHQQALRRQAVGRRRRRRPRAARRAARAQRRHRARCTRSASSARRCARSWRWPTASTSTSTQNKPWELAKKAGRTRALHDVCTRLHRGLPAADALPEAGAAGAGGAGRGASCSVEPLDLADAARAARRGHAIGEYKHLMQRVDAEAARRAVRAAAPQRPPPPQPRAAATLPGGEALAPDHHASTTSPRSTCASRRSSTARRSKARPSCCA